MTRFCPECSDGAELHHIDHQFRFICKKCRKIFAEITVLKEVEW